MTDKVYYPETIINSSFPGVEEVESDESKVVGVFVQEVTGGTEFPASNVVNELISRTLDTKRKKILGEYTFNETGAIKIGNYVSGSTGQILISPDGIVALNASNKTTFSLDGDTGDATFLGTVAAGSVVTGYIAVGGAGADVNSGSTQITPGKVLISGSTSLSDWSHGSDATKIDGGDIYTNTITATQIAAGTITATELAASYIQVGGAAGDVNSGATEIQAGKIVISGSTQLADWRHGSDQTKIDGGDIYANSITASQINAGTITATEIDTGTITADRMSITNLADLASYFNDTGTGRIDAWVINIGQSQDTYPFDVYSTTIDAGGNLSVNGNITMNDTDITNIDELKGDDGYLDMNSGHGNTETHHLDPSSSSSYNCGGSDRYWDYVNSDNFAEHSMGFYDGGVKMQNGSIISDVAAIKAMKPHPTETTPEGIPLIDKRTLPAGVFIPARDHDGTEWERDGDNNPIKVIKDKEGNVVSREVKPNADAENIGQLLGIALGAIKELSSRIDVLEGGV